MISYSTNQRDTQGLGEQDWVCLDINFPDSKFVATNYYPGADCSMALQPYGCEIQLDH